MDPMLPVTREVVWVSFSFFREFHFFPEAVLIRMASFFYCSIFNFQFWNLMHGPTYYNSA